MKSSISDWSSILYYVLWSIIVAVSVHDGYLVLINRWTISEDEQNPLGRWLLAIDGGDVRFLLTAKLIGTIVVATVLLDLFRKRARMAWVTITTLAFIQTWLVIYLSIG